MLLKKLDNLGSQLFEIPKLLTGPLLLAVFLRFVLNILIFCGQTLDNLFRPKILGLFFSARGGTDLSALTIIIVSVRLGKIASSRMIQYCV